MKMNQLVDALKKWIRGRKEEAEKKEKKRKGGQVAGKVQACR